MDKREIIALLNMDIENEHGAIIQYLTHAYAIGEGELACEIEAIAREEMRHLDFLAEKVIEMGGTLSLTRGKMRMKGTSVADWIKNDVLLEQDAIDPYREQIKIIKDKDLNRLLKRILSDELAHHEQFKNFINKAIKEELCDRRGKKNDAVARFLNWGIQHEYTVILQYLLHSYMAKDTTIKKELEDQAINEMQHMGWLAEELVGLKGFPNTEHAKVFKSKAMSKMLATDIKIEQQVTAEYSRAVKEVIEDNKLKKLIERIRDHEIYHTELFNKLMDKAVE